MVAGSFGPETTLVQRTTGPVVVVFATKVAGEFPYDVALGMAGQVVVDDSAGRFHEVETGRPIGFHAHVIDDHCYHIRHTGVQMESRWEVQCLVVASRSRVANPRAEICLIDPDRVAEGETASSGEVQGRLVAMRGKVASVDERAGMEPIVACNQTPRCLELENVTGIVAHCVVSLCIVGDCPLGVIVTVLNLWKRVTELPASLCKNREFQGRRRVCHLGSKTSFGGLVQF